VTVRLTPRASRTEIVGPRGNALVVKVTAPPAEERANEALRRLLAKAVGIPPGRVKIVRGQKGREKLLRLEGVRAAEAAERLG
jgi:uncharacterized protein (TIGR00251 family)